ncbi:anti-sigma factor [Hymenobacter guriensis]|uniref:Regulator of SigK n=1 Tax=Hymenobacter guriensis TaxID=2793065 RepID=A0ABS0L0Q4_9BACT|nr:anti-sigma factor [Hymenobacter guriensis]MBG8553701.1 anti-sigma factor [Hymenobacter guriensis]
MDIQQYIESGMLEQYVLGTLTVREQQEVEQLANEFPAVQAEISRIQQDLDAYAAAHAATPPAGMRERVLAGWQQAVRASEGNTQPAAPRMVASEPAPSVAPEAVVRSIDSAPSSGRKFGWLVAAAVALLTLSALGNYLLYNRLKETETNLQVAHTEQTRYAATEQAALKERDERTRQLEILRSEQFRAVDLKGTPKAPDALARVYYNAATRAVYVDVRHLPALPKGKQYQLWAMDKGQPVDAGVLTAAATAGDTLQQMKDIASAQAFALTVENEGGSPTPTLSTLTVIGNI